MSFIAVPQQELTNTFTMLDKQWMLVTASYRDRMNTMTASWGGLGVLWNVPVAYVFVRPQRFTQTLLSQNNLFTVSFYNEAQRDALKLCGAQSGRDTDKVANAGLTPVYDERGFWYFAEAEWVLCLKTLYVQQLDPAAATDSAVFEKHYPLQDYHHQYIAQVVDCLKRQS